MCAGVKSEELERKDMVNVGEMISGGEEGCMAINEIMNTPNREDLRCAHHDTCTWSFLPMPGEGDGKRRCGVGLYDEKATCSSNCPQ